MKRVIFIFLCIAIQHNVSAQKNISLNDIAIGSELGFLNGKSQVNLQMLAIAAIQKKKYAIGLGSGFDYYGYRTIPVFVEGKKFFGQGNRRPFVYAKTGLNIAWVMSSQQRMTYTSTGTEFSKFKNGLYADAGIGYTMYNSKGRGLFTGLGFCTKSLTESYNDYIWNGITSSLSRHEAKYRFNNIQLRMGYKF